MARKKARRYLSRKKGKMSMGECRQTKAGQPFCNGPQGVRFVSQRALAGLGYPVMDIKRVAAKAAGLGGRGSRRRGKMTKGECRFTKNGRKYCYTKVRGGGYRVKFMKR
jgi:hypothetical protein